MNVDQLPKDTEGRPVPYTTLWSSERPVFTAVDPLINTEALFHHGAQGDGEPIVTMPNAARARRSVMLRLCQVCGEPTRGDDWLGDIRIRPGQTLRVNGRHVPLVVDSWTCTPCLTVALTVCPGLLRRRPGPSLLRVASWIPVPTPERPKYLGPETPFGPVGFVLIAVTKAAEFSVYDFLQGSAA